MRSLVKAIITLTIGLGVPLALAQNSPVRNPISKGILFSSSFSNLQAADSAATAAHAPIYLDSNLTLRSNTALRAAWVAQGGVITLGDYNLEILSFSASPTLPAFHQNGRGQVTIDRRVCASPQWWGADPTDRTDSTAAFNDALAATGSACVPPGQYNIAGSVVVQDGRSMRVDPTAVLHRHSGGAKMPVLYVIHVGSADGASISTSYSGGQIIDNADSPVGAVVLGNRSNADTRNSWWWRFTDVSITAQSNPGDVTILVPSGQGRQRPIANYFGTIANVNINGGDTCMLLDEYANAHNVNNIQFWNCGTYALELRGAYANNINNFFVHTGSKNGLVGIALKDPEFGSAPAAMNHISNFTDESGGNADTTLFVDTRAVDNLVQGSQNTPRVGTIRNQNNTIILNGNVDASRAVATQSALFLGPFTVASLPKPGSPGVLAEITDGKMPCTTGGLPAGGGANKCFVGWNGSNWKEFGI